MKFSQLIHFYGVNEDNTVTFYVLDDNSQKQFYRSNARFKLLGELDGYDKDTALNVEFGLAYIKGKGLVLQLIRVFDVIEG